MRASEEASEKKVGNQRREMPRGQSGIRTGRAKGKSESESARGHTPNEESTRQLERGHEGT